MGYKSVTKEKKKQSEEMRSEQLASVQKFKKRQHFKKDVEQKQEEISQRKVEDGPTDAPILGFSMDDDEEE